MSGIVEFLRDRGVNVGWRGGWQAVKCPFHGDSNASASVHVDRGKFHCFGCGIFEDVIGLMRLEGASYAEAKREAAEVYGEGPASVRGESPARLSRDDLFGGSGDHKGDGRKVSSRRSLL